MPKASLGDISRAQRIIINGVTGAGKSTAAIALADALSMATGYTYAAIDFDEIGWAPVAEGEWTQRSDEEQERIAKDVAAGEHWVMTRPWRMGRESALRRADLMIYLDYPPHITLWRLTKRTFLRALLGRTCCNGNRETFAKALSSDSIIVWWWKTFRSRHASALEYEATPPSELAPPTIRLTHPSQLELILRMARS